MVILAADVDSTLDPSLLVMVTTSYVVKTEGVGVGLGELRLLSSAWVDEGWTVGAGRSTRLFEELVGAIGGVESGFWSADVVDEGGSEFWGLDCLLGEGEGEGWADDLGEDSDDCWGGVEDCESGCDELAGVGDAVESSDLGLAAAGTATLVTPSTPLSCLTKL